MITAIILEDEPQLLETNKLLLEQNFPDIKVVGEAGTIKRAVKLIQQKKPELVLLDIELADGNCFQVLNQCKPYTFKPIFVTAYNTYAIKAIKFSAIDYILKPVNEYEFCNAVNKAIESINNDDIKMQTDNLTNHFNDAVKSKKLVLRTSDTLHLVDIYDILFCKSDNSYTTFYLIDGDEIVVSKSIREYADLLSEYDFIQPHQSFLVNINNIAKIDKTDGGFIILKGGKEVPISSRRKQTVLDQLAKL